jgi:hypothetical protein
MVGKGISAKVGAAAPVVLRHWRSDLLMFVGLGLIVYAAIVKGWGAVVIGAVLMVAGLMAPRMTGPFTFGGPPMQFRGVLLPPSGHPPQTAGEESPPQPDPPPSIRRSEE